MILYYRRRQRRGAFRTATGRNESENRRRKTKYPPGKFAHQPNILRKFGDLD
jgi:hypothetical protein